MPAPTKRAAIGRRSPGLRPAQCIGPAHPSVGLSDKKTFSRREDRANRSAPHDHAPSMARPAGFEPATRGLEGRCSIHLSYGRMMSPASHSEIVRSYQRRCRARSAPTTGPGYSGLSATQKARSRFVEARSDWSGQRDSNPRPPAPKAGALPGCAMPRRQKTRQWYPPDIDGSNSLDGSNAENTL